MSALVLNAPCPECGDSGPHDAWPYDADSVGVECAATTCGASFFYTPEGRRAMTADDTARTDGPTLAYERQQMLMARPWHAAEGGSIWEITGEYARRRGRFTRCLAEVLPEYTHGGDEPMFKMMSAVGALGEVVTPGEIHTARRLLLVLADEPGTAYYVDDQPHVDAR